MANILRSCIRSSLGDLQTAKEKIKSSEIELGKKEIQAIEGKVSLPYYSLSEKIEDTYKSIYGVLHNVVDELLEGFSQSQKERTAIIVGTSIIDWNSIHSIESSNYEYKRKPFSTSKRSIDSYAKDISNSFGLNGFTQTINTACTSSANALLEASNLIDAGLYDYVIVVGIEVFSEMMSSGFYAMQLLSSTTLKSFDTDRDGTILGEAIAAILVSNEDSPWKIKGGYSNCDALSITSASENGQEFINMMRNSLMDAGVTAQEITALKAHATATSSNDIAEINAIKNVFESSVVFTALKPYIGHTIGACGALEIALFMACIDDGFLPRTMNHKKSILTEYIPLLEHKECFEGTFMLNFFGFGGNNTSIILTKEQK